MLQKTIARIASLGCLGNLDGDYNRSDEMNPAWFSLSHDSLYAQHLVPPANSNHCPTDVLPAHRSTVPSTDLPHIPYDRMWEDDIYWLPRLVRGEHFVGRADLDEGNVMRRYWFGSVSA